MKCPDCGEELVLLHASQEYNGKSYEYSEPFYKCLGCRQEYEPEDVEK